MLNFDVSKAVPHKSMAYLTLLIPGCFFEVSIFLSNPQLIANRAKDLQQAIPVSPYVLLASALLIAFVIGATAGVFVTFVELTVKKAYATRHSLVLRVLTATMKVFLKVLARRTPMTTVTIPGSLELDNEYRVMRAWRRLAAKLLSDRYGIQARHLKTDSIFYFTALADPLHEEVRGLFVVSIFHATGWCGLCAAIATPALRGAYYLGPCCILIAGGLLNSYHVARNTRNRLYAGLAGMRALVREYEKDRVGNRTNPEISDR